MTLPTTNPVTTVRPIAENGSPHFLASLEYSSSDS